MSREDRGTVHRSGENLFHSPTPLMPGCRDFWEICPQNAPHCSAPIGLYSAITGDLWLENGPELYELHVINK